MFAVMKELVRQKYTRLIYPEHPRGIDYDRERPNFRSQYPGGGGYAALRVQRRLHTRDDAGRTGDVTPEVSRGQTVTTDAAKTIVPAIARRSAWARLAGLLGGSARPSEALPPERQHELETVRSEDHRSARRGRWRRADDVPDHPHRHEPGHLRARRSARRREQELRADAEEPAAGRESLQRRQAVPQDQAVRRARAAGRRRVRRRDGAVGPGGQGVQRAGLPDARRQVPRQHPLLRGHDRVARSEGLRPAPEGAPRPGLHLAEDGPGRRSGRRTCPGA